jgi:acyl-CoA thioester hydrolase
VPPESIDELGHVNNLEYLRWMLDAAFHHSEKAGCTAATLASGSVWVVRSHKIEYLKPAFAGDKIVILTWVSNFRKVRSLRKYKVFRENDLALLSHGETDWVYVDIQNGKLRPIPAEIAGMFEIIPEDQEPKRLEL